MKRPLLGITAAFILGILIEETLNVPIFYLFCYAAIFVLLAALFIRTTTRYWASLLICALFLGCLVFKNYNSLPDNHIKNIVSIPDNSSRHVFIEGRIVNNPTEKETYFHQLRTGFLLDINAIKLDNDWQKARGILSANVVNPGVNFAYGSAIALEGELSLAKGASNPGEFDYRKFLNRKKIFFALNTREGDFSKRIGRGQINPVKSAMYKISRRIEVAIQRFAPEPNNAILEAILLGKRQGMDEAINDDFVKTGTVHILAISGLHVGLLAAIFMALFKLFRIPFKASILCLTALLVLYCIMVDTRPPVTRATIMIMVFLFGKLLRREQDPLNTLSVSALIILILNPQDIFDAGFQLSFLTVGSIIYMAPRLEERLLRRPIQVAISQPGLLAMTLDKLQLFITRAALVSFSAWLGSAPFIAKYFNIVSPIAVIANLFVVPWMFFVLASSLAFIIFSFFSGALGLIFSQTANLNISILLKVVSMFSNLPFSYFRVKAPSWISIFGFYLFIFLFLNRRRLRIRAAYLLTAALIGFNIFIWQGVLRKDETLTISFLDVGKGDAIFLEFPKGATMLIDAGEGLGVDMGRLVVGRFLAFKGINKIDAVVSTHPHTDHVGGLVSVVKNFKAGCFIENGDWEDNQLYRECQRVIKQKGVKRFIVRAGDEIKGFHQAEVNVLNPPAKKFFNQNDNSVVLNVKYKDFSALLCADIMQNAAANLVKEDRAPQVILLKAPHHGGSIGNAAAEFLNAAAPKIVVISTGRNRKVDSVVLSILEKSRAAVYRTDVKGAIFVTANSNGWSIDTYKK